VVRRRKDGHVHFHLRRLLVSVAVLVVAIAVFFVWHPGQAGLFLGLIAAGVAFASQEVLGAIAGWFNIVTGRIYRVGDRVQLGGVQGDVIDITLVRTKILEMGSESTLPGPEPGGGEEPSWVHGRQYTGRVVSISNKASFTAPVFN